MNNLFKSADEIYNYLQERVKKVLPGTIASDAEYQRIAEVVFKINSLAAQKGAVILKHNYMDPIIFSAVDGYCGDSLELSRRAAQTKADTIVFCGVNFMAQTAKILNPGKKILIPVLNAGCSLADDITANDVRMIKEKFPGLPVVVYINSTAEVKAEADVCCTSGNVLKAVDWALDKFKTKSLIFIPDKHMAANIACQRNMEVLVICRDGKPDKKMDASAKKCIITWESGCYVHEQYTGEDVRAIKKNNPCAVVIAHPECRPEVAVLADFCASTAKMAEYVKDAEPGQKIALLTESSMADNLAVALPRRADDLLRLRYLRCKNMAMTTVENLLEALETDRHKINIDESLRKKAELAVKRMTEIG